MTYEHSSGRMPYNKDEAVRIAEEAAGIIDAGWAQHMLTDYAGAYCAFGALNMAVFGHHQTMDWYEPNHRAVREKAIELLPPRPTGLGSSLVSYNNAETTTQSDVSDLFRRVAKELAAEGDLTEAVAVADD